MKFAITESFYSIQGEGKYCGVPSVFLRLFGCNKTCDGFGMPRGEKSQARFHIDAKKHFSIESVPLVKTGCDSFLSWDPRFKHLAKHYTSTELAENLTNLIPNQTNWKGIHLIMTGGEPLLGWQKLYPELFMILADRGLEDVTFETNGTQKLQPALVDYITNTYINFTFSVSPKLSASGEKWEDSVMPHIVAGYSDLSPGYFKFVVDQVSDLNEVVTATDEYIRAGIDWPIYLMPVGGCNEMYQANAAKVCKMAMERGWRYSPRLQVDLFGNAWGT